MKSHIELLSAKTRPPVPRGPFHRLALETKLLNSSASKSTIVCGPAGSGKSILLSNAFKSYKKNGALAWINLDKNESLVEIRKYLKPTLSSRNPDESALVIENINMLSEEDLNELLSDLSFLSGSGLSVAASMRSLEPLPASHRYASFSPSELQASRSEIASYLDILFPLAHKDSLKTLSEAIYLLSDGWPIAITSLARSYLHAKNQTDTVAITNCAHLLSRYQAEVGDSCCSIPLLDYQFASEVFNEHRLEMASLFDSEAASGLELKTPKAKPTSSSSPQLTPTEAKILHLLIEGVKPKAVAEQTFTSEATVRTHIKHIYKKLDAHERKDAVKKAILLGLS